MNTITILFMILLVIIVIAIITGMVRNVRNGKSFCGADYGDVVNGGRKKI